MDVQKSVERFDQAVATLPTRIRETLQGLPASLKETAFEVRLRVDKPIAITCPGRNWFVDSKSQLHNIPRHCITVSQNDLAQAVVSMCSYSVHSHQKEFAGGYVSLRGGHRAGICGTAVVEDGKVTTIRDVTSVNLRIAREVRGVATPLIQQVFRKKVCGVLVIGPPTSGKTTLLRDLARQLADGALERYVKVAVVDERGELGAVFEGVPQNDLGASCDILSGYPKGEGILTAVRTLSPEVIICDEIGSAQEVDSILDGLNCGVKIVASAHADSMEELLGRRQIQRLLRNRAFDKIVRLGNLERPGEIVELTDVEELQSEIAGYPGHHSLLYHDGNVHGVKLVQSGFED